MHVTALMPARGRVRFSRTALDCFLAQTYLEKELLIADDKDDPAFPEGLPADCPKEVTRIVLNERLTIPEKRNFLCGIASSEVLWHLDSDDWSAPERMAQQVELLEWTNAAVVGYHSIPFYRDSDRTAYRYSYGSANFACGSSMCFRKSFWVENHFREDKKLGSDNHFAYAARDRKRLHAVDGRGMLVARIHQGNSNKKVLGANFRPLPLSELPAPFMETL